MLLKKISLLFLSLLSFNLISCQKVQVSQLNRPTGEMMAFDSDKFEDNYHYKEKLHKEVAIFPIFNQVKAPNEIEKELVKLLGQTAEKTGFFNKVISGKEYQERYHQNKVITRQIDTYLDTLNSVSISDKDLSEKIGKSLGVKNFLNFQISFWPGKEDEPSVIRMKYRLIEAKSGEIIWTGIDEKLVEDVDPKDYQPQAVKIAQNLSEAFYYKFSEKWHQKRFRNLAAVAK